MSYRALVRRLDGQAAVSVALTGDSEIEMRVGGEFHTLKRADWQALPAYDPVPCSGRESETTFPAR